jgi:methionyl-tRNA synthetase
MAEHISIDDFKKVEISVGQIKSAEPVEGSEKLLRLTVDFGEEAPRQVVSGIAKYFPEPAELVGKKCAFATNLEPRKLMGLESQAMILATGGDEGEPLYLFESEAAPGSKAR